jgi:hypothetical protein
LASLDESSFPLVTASFCVVALGQSGDLLLLWNYINFNVEVLLSRACSLYFVYICPQKEANGIMESVI